jgi:tetratricopeptide (TPR) repeat protein
MTIAVFAAVRHSGFVSLDDPQYVSENPHIAQGLTWAGVAWAFTSGYASNWHPLTWLSHMLDISLFGMHPGWHHLTNLALHLGSTILLFWFLLRTTRAIWPSAFVAALFAIHPLHVESVAWIAERKDVLSTMFLMLTLLAYAAYAYRPATWRYGVVMLVFALGLLAKPMLVTLPVLLLLLDVWPLKRTSFAALIALVSPGARARLEPVEGVAPARALLIEKAPMLALVLVSSIATVIAQQHGGAVQNLALVPLDVRVENALLSYVTYAGSMLWPTRLVIYYALVTSLPGWGAIGAAILIGTATWLAVRAARSRPYVTVGWLWYLGTLVPVIGLVQVGQQSHADRYTYVPLTGLFIIAAWGVSDLVRRAPRWRRVAAVAAAAVVLLMATMAHAQVQYWHDSGTVWTHAVDASTGANRSRADYGLGLLRGTEGRYEEAAALLTEAVTIDRNFAEAHSSLARVLMAQGKPEDAAPHLAEALRLNPKLADARSSLAATHTDRGLALFKEGQFGDAAAEFTEAIRLAPELADAHHSLGKALGAQGKIPEAIEQLTIAVRLAPANARFHYDLGFGLANEGKTAESIVEFTEALRLDNDIADAHTNLAVALAQQGKMQEAFVHFKEAARLKPDVAGVHRNLALAEISAGQYADALKEFKEILRIDPGNAEAQRAVDALAGRIK